MSGQADVELMDWLTAGLDSLVEKFAREGCIPNARRYRDLDRGALSDFRSCLNKLTLQSVTSIAEQLEAPPWFYMIPKDLVEPGAWLIHFTKSECFSEFDRGVRIDRLHLARWAEKSRKIQVEDRKRNLSPSLPLRDRVWAFAYSPQEADRFIQESADDLQQSFDEPPDLPYGAHIVAFQSKQGVVAYHRADHDTQVIVPIGADYNHHCGYISVDPEENLPSLSFLIDGERIAFGNLVEAAEYLAKARR
jgi:hypothetical protein